MNVGLHRLSPFKVGRRRYAYPTLTQDDLAGVRHAVLCGSPVSNLSAMLYHSPDFQSHGRKGWTLKTLDIAAIMGPAPSEDTVKHLPGYRPAPENPVDAKPSEETSTGSDQPTNEHSREAMQGGGA